MASTVGSTPSTFVQVYSDQFATGKMDFVDMSTFFLNSLKFLTNKIKNNKLDKSDNKLHEYISIDREILNTAVEAQEHYLNHTLLGTIEKVVNSILNCFGVKSSLEEIKEQKGEIEKELLGLGINDCSDDKKPHIESKSRALLARAIAYGNETHFFSIGENASKPSKVFIAKSNGDVYEVPIDAAKAKGGTRYYYEGKLHVIEHETVKPVGVLSNLPPRLEPSYIEKQQEKFSSLAQEMEKEFTTLQCLKPIHRIVRAYDHFSTTLAETGIRTASFMMLKHHKEGDLYSFMKLEAATKMPPNEKLDFMMSLLTTYKDLHEKNLIHRDVKAKNIVVRQNKEGQYIPTVIDVGTCIPDSDVPEKREFSSTVDYWPPEYIQACVNTINNACDATNATSKDMDTWSLGLVFFQFFYGKDLVGDVFKFNDYLNNFPQINEQNTAKKLDGVIKNNLPEFIKEMQSEHDVRAEWANIKKAIQEHSFVWERLILPMLATDPKKRPSMGKLHNRLQNHIDPPSLSE